MRLLLLLLNWNALRVSHRGRHLSGLRRNHGVSLLLLLLLLQPVMRLLPGSELGRLQLLQVELLSLRDQLLALVLET